MSRYFFLSYLAVFLFLAGCSQGETLSGVDQSPPYTQAQVEEIVARAPSGTVGIYSASRVTGEAYYLMGCKINWVYNV